MAYKKLLVQVDDAEAGKAALATAHMVASSFGSHIEVFHVQADSKEAVPLLGEGMSGTMIEEMIELADQDAIERSSEIKSIYDAYRKEHGLPERTEGGDDGTVSLSWREEIGREDERMAHWGRVADLIVMARPDDSRERPSLMTLHAAIFETRRPVLMAPAQPVTSIGKNIAVSWNGTAEASAAVTGAMPLLEKADKVNILNVETEKSLKRIGSGELAAWLAWHGIEAEVVQIAASGSIVGEVVTGECRNLGCDLLVMGAFTHSRLIQIILGGVTRYVISNAQLPVLFAH